MTGDTIEVAAVAVQMLLGALGPWWIVRWDERRLDAVRLSRAWPPSTRLSAAVAFGPLCLPVHFWRTRRSWWGVVLGLGLAIALTALSVALSAFLGLFAGSA